ncbi:DUF4160 domain-containing protein [Martelella sp. AMO21009]
MPTVLRKYGIRFHFYGSDMGEPPHIHASGQGGKAKVWLHSGEMAECKGFNTVDVKRILSVVEEHKVEFLEAWDDFFGSIS